MSSNFNLFATFHSCLRIIAVNDSNNNDDTVALSMMGRVMTESGKAKYEGAITELCPKVRAIVGQGPAGLHPFNLPANMSSEISNMKSSASLPPPPPILQKLFSTGVSSTEHTSSHSGPGNTTSDSSPFARVGIRQY